MNHLINAVEGGPAARTLKGLQLIETNLDGAWDKVFRRFHNPNFRLTKYLESVISLKPIRKKNVSDLNDILDIVSSARQGLKYLDLGPDISNHDIWFVHYVVRALNLALREAWVIFARESRLN